MKPLKLCMVTTFYPPYNFGGDGIFVYRLTNALARRGHEVHVIHDLDAYAALTDHRPRPAYPSHPNVVLYPLSSRGIGPLDLLLTHQLGRPLIKRKQIKTILERTGFDVIHFHNISLIGGPHILEFGKAIKLCSLHDYWFVCTMHVLWRFDREPCTRRTCLACAVRGRRPPQLWRYTNLLERVVHDVDAFIGPSHFTRQIHEANGFPAPIRVLPHFLPDTEVQASHDSLEPYQRHSGRPYFLFVGRLEKIKGVQQLLDVFRGYQAADLLIAGTGTYASELQALAKDLPHVYFLGLLDHKQLGALYRGAIAVIIPSLCYESFGWVTVEACVRRTPIIVHDIGALPEIVKRSGSGLIYQTNEELLSAMERLRTQPDLRRQLGELGYQSYLNHYTEARYLDRYCALINELQATRFGNEVIRSQ